MNHADYLELLAGSALDDLDTVEQHQLRVHAANCAECAVDAARLDDVMTELSFAAPARTPSAGLEARILAAVAAEPRAAVVPATPVAPPRPVVTTPRPSEARSWWQRPAFSFAAVGLAVVLAVSSVVLSRQASDLRSDVALRDAALAVISNPAHLQAPLEAKDGNTAAAAMAIYLPHSTTGYVMATGLAATPAGKVYQLWFADAAGVHPLGTYRYDGQGPFVAPFGVDLTGSAAAMVTLEPTGGSTGDPGPEVVFGTLPAS
jgi:hypothetical protein